MNLTMEILGLDKLVDKLGAGAKPMIRTLTRAVAEEIKNAIARYPGPVARPIQWKSRKQRAFYLAQRQRHGLGPYVRQSDPFSQRLGPSWATEERDEVNAVVGTRVTYARWVQSAEDQQPMHKNTGWVTDKEAMEEVRQSGVAERLLDDIMQSW